MRRRICLLRKCAVTRLAMVLLPAFFVLNVAVEVALPATATEMIAATNTTTAELTSSETTRHAQISKQSRLNFHEPETLQILANSTAPQAAKQIVRDLTASVQTRLATVYQKAHSAECRAKIGEHFGYFLNAIGMENSLPYADVVFKNECPETKPDFDNLPKNVTLGHIQNRTYQPPLDEALYLDDPSGLRLLYAILTHDAPNSTMRLIEALYEEGHLFVIHVDGKAEDTFSLLAEYAADRDYVYMVPSPYRVRVNWGGYSMVNATMQLLRYAFALTELETPLEFHKVVHLASSSYPIASNLEIRRRLASYPLDANFLNVILKPTNPGTHAWHYFVECDDAVHRIYRLHPATEKRGSGIDIYTSSQWFIISREFAEYLARAEKGTLVQQYLEYTQHVVVADEAFFGTVLRHTTFCSKHHNTNFLHLQFDRWESDVAQGKRDQRKCIMPQADRCGRSPTTMTLDYLPVLELSGDLFARKFDDAIDPKIKDVIDERRAMEEKRLLNEVVGESDPDLFNPAFEGHGILIVAKATLNDTTPLCLGLGPTGNRVRLMPCFHERVLPTLAPGWETGAVVVEETLVNNRWELGPCSSGGVLKRLEDGEISMTPGILPTGPHCLLLQMDGLRKGRCIDSESERLQPGGQIQVFPCMRRWHQFVAFGDGKFAPKSSMIITVPKHIANRIKDNGREQDSNLCIGVSGRGSIDDQKVWEEDADHPTTMDENFVPEIVLNQTDNHVEDKILPLSAWIGKQLVTTSCINVDGVIEWLFIPYILEEEEENDEGGDAIDLNSTDASDTGPAEEEL